MKTMPKYVLDNVGREELVLLDGNSDMLTSSVRQAMADAVDPQGRRVWVLSTRNSRASRHFFARCLFRRNGSSMKLSAACG